MKKIIAAAFAGALAVSMSAGVSSASVTLTNGQALQANGDPVSASRSDPNNVLDGDMSTFFSLGIGGFLTASIAPAIIAGVSVFEITNGNAPGFPESAEVFLLPSGGGGRVLLGEIFNEASGGTTTSANGATITATANDPSTGITSFLIDVGTNVGSVIGFVDTTADNFSPTGNRDGFDIAELRIAAVPVPFAGLLMLTALGGAAVAYRKRKSA